MLACLLAYLLESNDCLRRYAGLLGIRLPKTSLEMVSRAMEVDIEEATLPFPNRELRIRKSRRRRISMLACLLAYLLESYACLLACLPTRIQRLFGRYAGFLGIRLPKTSLGMEIEAWCLQCA